MRTELHLLKRFPFQLICKLETPNINEPYIEHMQTYFDIDS